MKFLLTMMLLSTCIMQCKAGEHAATDYQFKLGHWSIDAKAMKPDQTHDTGIGYEHVFINEVGVFQDELCIDMKEMPDAVGATMRTFDRGKNFWHITWVAYGSESGTGTAINSGDGVVESFPGEDQYGSYVDQMNFTIYNPNHYKANLTRTYDNGGYKLDCIFCYEAKRIAETDKGCGLISRSAGKS